MDEYEELLMEKEMFERMYRQSHNRNIDEFDLADMKNKDRYLDDRQNLGFTAVSENTYRVVNRKTGRFHNPELGIDEVV